MGKAGAELLGRPWFKLYTSKPRHPVGELFPVFTGIRQVLSRYKLGQGSWNGPGLSSTPAGRAFYLDPAG
jgi:hypothetical protein